MALAAEASNGQEAIQQFRAHRPDVTLMDLQMPEMDGVDAMIAIRGEFPDARTLLREYQHRGQIWSGMPYQIIFSDSCADLGPPI